MKSLLVIIIFLSFTVSLAQNTFYKVIYKIDVRENIEGKDTFNSKTDDYEVLRKSTVLLKKVSEARKDLRYVLYANNSKSIYRLVEFLLPDEDKFAYQIATILGGKQGEIYYKNINDNEKFKHTDLLGKQYNVLFPVNQYEWTITTESKIINGFKCYRAFTKWEEHDYNRDIDIKFTPEAWFTNDIPIPFGPKGIDGLPGLVLEATFNGKTFFTIDSINSIELKQDHKYIKKPDAELIEYNEYLKRLVRK